MPDLGQTIVNPVAGDTVTFLEFPSVASAELVMEMTTVAGGLGPPLHVHPRSSETFTVVQGAIVVTEAGREVVVEQGQTHTVPPGVPHGFAGHPDLDATTQVVMDRPGRMAEFLETFYELNRAGRTDAEGRPTFPQIALTFSALRDDIRPVVAPWPAQLVLYALLRPVARRQGLKPFYRSGELTRGPGS